MGNVHQFQPSLRAFAGVDSEDNCAPRRRYTDNSVAAYVPTSAGRSSAPPAHPSQPGSAAGGAARYPDCWAAYGRFLCAAIRGRCPELIAKCHDGLHYFRRRYRNVDASTVYAYQARDDRRTDIWTAASKALDTLTQEFNVDTLNLYIAGTLPAAPAGGDALRTVHGGRYLAIAIPYETRDILELGDSLDDFLRTLGHSNRRHLKARHKEAMESGMHFEISSDPGALGAEERFDLGLLSRPVPFPRERVNAYDTVARSKDGFFHASLRSPEGLLLSYCCGFLEADSSVILYQFNRKDQPKLSLTMTLRSFLIHHWAGTSVKRIVFPMGLAGHLTHAATTNPITQIFFMRRAPVAVAKALLMSLLVPASDASRMVRASGFLRHLLAGAANNY